MMLNQDMTYVLRRAYHNSGRTKCLFQMTLESHFFPFSYSSSLDLFSSCESVGGKTFLLCFLLTLNTKLLTLPITKCVVVFSTPSTSATQRGVWFNSVLALPGDIDHQIPQSDEGIRRTRSERVQSAEASVPVKLGCVTLLACLPTQKLSKSCPSVFYGGFIMQT